MEGDEDVEERGVLMDLLAAGVVCKKKYEETESCGEEKRNATIKSQRGEEERNNQITGSGVRLQSMMTMT
jgi:hypothetical protein